MKTMIDPVFPQAVASAVSNLKSRLQQTYEQAYPGLADIIHIVLDKEEARAWELSSFPHLLLPDLVDAHIAKLNLRPTEPRHAVISLLDNVTDDQPAFALCG
jgi:hypothetical protein